MYPVPRDEGFEFYLCQYHQHQSAFTTLLDYQVQKAGCAAALPRPHRARCWPCSAAVIPRPGLAQRPRLSERRPMPDRLQMHQENARAVLTLTHYQELRDSKGGRFRCLKAAMKSALESAWPATRPVRTSLLTALTPDTPPPPVPTVR